MKQVYTGCCSEGTPSQGLPAMSVTYHIIGAAKLPTGLNGKEQPWSGQ